MSKTWPRAPTMPSYSPTLMIQKGSGASSNTNWDRLVRTPSLVTIRPMSRSVWIPASSAERPSSFGQIEKLYVGSIRCRLTHVLTPFQVRTVHQPGKYPMTRLNLLQELPSANSTSFWTVWMALARVVGVNLDQSKVRIDNIVGIKERLFHVYESFVASPKGVQRWGLQDALSPVKLHTLFSAPAEGADPTREELDVVVCGPNCQR